MSPPSQGTEQFAITSGKRQGSLGALFRLRPHPRRFPSRIELNVDYIRIAADRAILAIGLVRACGRVQGDDDRFAAGGAGVAAFVMPFWYSRSLATLLFLHHAILNNRT